MGWFRASAVEIATAFVVALGTAVGGWTVAKLEAVAQTDAAVAEVQLERAPASVTRHLYAVIVDLERQLRECGQRCREEE